MEDFRVHNDTISFSSDKRMKLIEQKRTAADADTFDFDTVLTGNSDISYYVQYLFHNNSGLNLNYCLRLNGSLIGTDGMQQNAWGATGTLLGTTQTASAPFFPSFNINHIRLTSCTDTITQGQPKTMGWFYIYNSPTDSGGTRIAHGKSVRSIARIDVSQLSTMDNAINITTPALTSEITSIGLSGHDDALGTNPAETNSIAANSLFRLFKIE
jgi:hypothetical protein